MSLVVDVPFCQIEAEPCFRVDVIFVGPFLWGFADPNAECGTFNVANLIERIFQSTGSFGIQLNIIAKA